MSGAADIDQAVDRVVLLEKNMNAANLFLNAYDQRQCMQVNLDFIINIR